MPSDVQVIRQVRRLLDEMSLTGPPTPIEACVAHAKLTIERQISLGSLPPDVYHALLEDEIFHLAIEHVSGLLDRRNSLIYLKAGMNVGRQNFVTLHEVGHGWLPWQHLLATHPDGDENLDEHARQRRRKVVEWEANTFAAETLFQLDRFELDARESAFELQSAIDLAGLYGASIHAALHRYVQRHHRRAVLLVLEAHPMARSQGSRFKVVAVHRSIPFSAQYRGWNPPRAIEASVIRPLLNRTFVTDLEEELYIEGDRKVTAIHLQGFYNTHNILLFGRPQDGQRTPHRAAGRIIRTR